jgi:hypothetical protein
VGLAASLCETLVSVQDWFVLLACEADDCAQSEEAKQTNNPQAS